MKPFQHLDLPNEVYHSGPEYLDYKSRSKITRFINHGARGYGLEKRGIKLFTGNAGTSLGTVVDTWWDAYASDRTVELRDLYATPPEDVLTSNGQRRGNKYKAWEEDHLARGVAICGDAEIEKAELMIESLKGSRLAMELLEATTATQRSIFWETDGGHKVKIRADGDNGRVPYDLKTTSSDFNGFPKKAWELGYADQAALYLDGFVAMGLLDEPEVEFKFVVVQSVVPYRTKVLVFPQSVVDVARARVYNALDDMREAEESGNYSDTDDDVVAVMDVPDWILGA